MSTLSDKIAQRVFETYSWLDDNLQQSTLSGLIEREIFAFNVAEAERNDAAGIRRGDSIARVMPAPKPSKVVYDDNWWRDVVARCRAAVEARDATRIVQAEQKTAWNLEARRLQNEWLEGPRESADQHDAASKAFNDYLAARPNFEAPPSDPAVWVSRVAFTFDYKGTSIKAKAVKQTKVPAPCYWPGGELPKGLTILTSDGSRPTFTGDYFAKGGFDEDCRLHATWKDEFSETVDKYGNKKRVLVKKGDYGFRYAA